MLCIIIVSLNLIIKTKQSKKEKQKHQKNSLLILVMNFELNCCYFWLLAKIKEYCLGICNEWSKCRSEQSKIINMGKAEIEQTLC